jgi:DNA (cytosine-5)-methyltransferase 1
MAFERMLSKNPGAWAEASQEAWLLELGQSTHDIVRERIESVLGSDDRWVLIGGPPCQAYSLVGRSRMRRVQGEAFELDERHRLYQEYLKIVADRKPAVFVMENVKGLLSSQLDGDRVFHQIVDDLSHPSSALRGSKGDEEYRIYPVASDGTEGMGRFVVRAEDHGVPQARHRVILLGVRLDVGKPARRLTPSGERVATADVIGDLPPIRSGISRATDGATEWLTAVREGVSVITSALQGNPNVGVASLLSRVVEQAAASAARHASRGEIFTEIEAPTALESWYADPELEGVTGHQSRAHMKSDLWRYLFAAAFAEALGRSPTLRDFPSSLLPAHRNVTGVSEPIFADRFRVQLSNRPSTTVTSHISKDGHGFIHYDPSQVRSLTAREAARLQTFPDSYEFEGTRTAQLHQIGNAVPPLLAHKIAGVVRDLLA